MKNIKHLLFLSILCSLVLFTNCSEEDAAAIADELENANYTLTVKVSPTEGGTVSYQRGPFLVGTKVTLTASANTNYAFKEWTGAFNGTTNPMELIMNADNTVTAVFELLDTDADGVTDDIDVCQSTPEGESADETGCSPSQVDTDGDGVTDDNDDCPDTPEGSSVSENGCITIFLDENGVTVKVTEDAVIGESYQLNGISYLVVDSTLLYEMINVNKDFETEVVTTNVTNMSYLFFKDRVEGQYEFNLDISGWDVSNVINMAWMFQSQNNFDQDISRWDVRNVEDMSYMFSYNNEFNQDISNWDVGNVTDMSSMFGEARSFNQDLSNWDVSNVTDMSGLFVNTTSFNQNLSSWDVSNVTNMRSMFRATYFNQDIGGWDVGKVTNMEYMLAATPDFNQDIGGWDVSSVTNMRGMFEGSGFNQDLSMWDVRNVTDCYDFTKRNTTPVWTLPKPNWTNCNGFTDKDRDGIIDENDSCPDTPEGTTVQSCGCSSDQGGCYADFSGVFGGMTYDPATHVYNFPTGSEVWAGVLNDRTDLYPFSFPNGGSITFQAAVQTAGDEVNVSFRFEKAPHPNVDPAFSTENVLVTGTVDDEETYTVEIPAQDAANTYRSLIMYLVENDIPVEIHDVFVKVNP